MRLERFRVTDFRSVKDTDWIDASRVTALVGTNESGKSNVLLALWKLKPARDGKVDLLADVPRSRYHIIREMVPKPIFIRARFRFSEDEGIFLAALLGCDPSSDLTATVSRRLDENVLVSFSDEDSVNGIEISSISAVLSDALATISELSPTGKTETSYRQAIIDGIRRAQGKDKEAGDQLSIMHEIFSTVSPSRQLKSSIVASEFKQFLRELAANIVYFNAPYFVYYANYGNLDSEIYLPHVIHNLQRTDISGTEAAKTRTLRVLFEYVNLEPQEILQLGTETGNSADQIQLDSRKKSEREILLQSASSDLTQKFRDWWKQGNHKFQFRADGNHFRIWVSDDIRIEEVELEGRSAGLQWFLSFFLVFLVESAASHKNAVLLLDEPGVSLHPIAQKDLFEFFDTLSEENQLFYTSHSPFMVNSNQLDRVRAVYFNKEGDDRGLTKVSSDLRAGEKQDSRLDSIYPVHAALGLSTSEALLMGSTQVIVEGPSDQFYFTAIKNLLIGRGIIHPKRELLFLPTGGVSGIKAVVPILAGRDENLPIVVLDGDEAGKSVAKSLRKTLYNGQNERVICLDAICDHDGCETEDLIPHDIFSWAVTRYFRGPEEGFSDYESSQELHVRQVEDYADKHGIELQLGWKVEVAKRVKSQMSQNADSIDLSCKRVGMWTALFKKFEN